MDGEQRLIELARKKDRSAMEALYQGYFGALYRFVRHKVATDEVAEDICAEAFVKSFEKLGQFSGKSSYKTWLYTIARNMVVDWYGRQRTESRDLNEVGGIVGGGSEVGKEEGRYEEMQEGSEADKQISRDVERQVKGILSELPERYRLVLEYRYLGGLSLKETAELMGTNANNIKVIQNRAIKKANQILGKNHEF